MKTLAPEHNFHLTLLRDSLLGLAVGDGFGEHFFGPPVEALQAIEVRRLPPPYWFVTDDTVMACGIAEELVRNSTIDETGVATK